MKQKITSYIDQLKYDKSLEKSTIAKYLTNVRFVVLLVISIIVFGIFSFTTLPRRLNPEVEIPVVTIVTLIPGSGPGDVEQLVSIPLEKELQNAKGIDTITSISQENASIISTEFFSNVGVEDARDEVQRIVDSIPDLPDEALAPKVSTLDFEDVPVWEFTLTSSGSQASLEQVARELESTLENISSVDRMVISGIEEREVKVVLKQEEISEYQVNPGQLSGIISAAASSFPAGSSTSGSSVYPVSFDKQLTSVEAVRALPLSLGAAQGTLGDIAQVKLASKRNQKRTYVSSPEYSLQPAVKIAVYKVKTADITKTQQKVLDVSTEFLEPYKDQITLISISNTADEITDQFNELYSNFMTTIILVFLTLLIFVGIRQATIASLSIPLTFLISFSVIKATGQTLNFLSLFSLLLALGLLVDDAIVIISSMTSYFKTGRFSAKEAGLLTWRDYITPIWTTTITTIWAFLPLLLSSGVIGEFIKPIPVVVSATLAASTSVAVLITLPLLMMLFDFSIPKRVKVLLQIIGLIILVVLLGQVYEGQPLAGLLIALSLLFIVLMLRWRKNIFGRSKKVNKSNKVVAALSKVRGSVGDGFVDLSRVREKYKKFIHKVVSSRRAKIQVVIGVVIFSIFSYALLPLGFVKGEFFPKTESDILYVGLELPNGTNLAITEQRAMDISEKIKNINEVELLVTEIGQPPRTGGFSVSQGSDNQAQLSVRLPAQEERERSVFDVKTEIEKILSDEEGLTSTIFIESGGPPAGSDVTLKIIGEDMMVLDEIATEIEEYLAEKGTVDNIGRSVKPGTSKIAFKPNQSEITRYGMNSQDIGFWLRTSVSGFKLGEIALDGDEDKTEVNFYVGNELLSTDELSQISVSSQTESVSIDQLGSFVLESSPTQITRENGSRTLTITAGIKQGFNAQDVNKELLSYVDNIKTPPGYSFASGGANEENQESVNSIMQAMLLSAILILGTMVVQLGSFRQSVIVLMVIPLAISGVFILFSLSGTPLSFPALIGVLALFGIVVNNSIMVVDKINQNLTVGMQLYSAVADGAASRLEPIFFSSLTTIIGLIPITLSDPVWRGLGGAIIAGLSVSGMVMLLFIPVVYVLFYSGKSN